MVILNQNNLIWWCGTPASLPATSWATLHIFASSATHVHRVLAYPIRSFLPSNADCYFYDRHHYLCLIYHKISLGSYDKISTLLLRFILENISIILNLCSTFFYIPCCVGLFFLTISAKWTCKNSFLFDANFSTATTFITNIFSWYFYKFYRLFFTFLF